MPRLRRRVLFIVITLLAFVTGAILYVRSSSEGRVWAGTATNLTTTPASKSIKLTGEFFSVNYPNNFSEVPGSRKVDAQTERYTLVSRNFTASTIGLSVQALNGATINEDASYHLRRTYPNLYEEHDQTVGGEKVYVFRRVEGEFEAVAFWPHRGLLASIALSSPNKNTELNQQFQNLLTAWRWLPTDP